MALKKCKECGGDVAQSAKACSHCGIKNPGITWKDNLLGSFGLGMIVLFVFTFCSENPDDIKIATVPATELLAPNVIEPEKEAYR